MVAAIIIVIVGVQSRERIVQSCRSVAEEVFLGNSSFVLDLEELVRQNQKEGEGQREGLHSGVRLQILYPKRKI